MPRIPHTQITDYHYLTCLGSSSRNFIFKDLFLMVFSFFFFFLFFLFFSFCSLNMLIFTCQLYFSKAGEKHRKIFLTQGSNLGLLHCGHVLYCLSHQGSLIKHKAGEKQHSKVCISKGIHIMYMHTHTWTCLYIKWRDFPGCSVIEPSPSYAGGAGSILGGGAEVPHA